MAIRFKQEQVKTEVVVAREVVKDVVTGDIELANHDLAGQVSEILDVKAQLREVKPVIVDGGVEISGVIVVNILYNTEIRDLETEELYAMTHHQDARLDFENFIDIPEARPGMHILLNLRVADITYDVLEAEMLETAITVINFCALSEVQELDYISRVTGVLRDEVMEEQLRIEEWVGDENIRATVAEEVELKEDLPRIDEVVAVIGEVVKTEYKTLENAVSCDGVMEVSVIYRGEDEKIYVLDERLEFSHTLDLYGVVPGMTVTANYRVNEMTAQMVTDERARVVVQVECYAKVTRPRRLTVVTDIVNERVDTEKMTVVLEEVVGNSRVKDSIVHRFNVPPTRPDIKGVVQAYSRVKDLSTIINSGGVVVEGNLEGTAYYRAKEDDYYAGELMVCLKDYFDFDNYIPIEDCMEGMDVYLEVEVKRTTCQVLNDRTMEMTVLLEKWAKITSRIELDCVTDLVEVSSILDEENLPSYLVYVVQRGDTLYKIARRYKIDTASLIQVNQLEDPDYLELGQKILIPKSLLGVMD